MSNIRISYVAKNGGRAPLTVSEAGFYRLVLRSRKPVAKEFQRWVTHEVLPQIRRTGGYIPVSDTDDEKLILCPKLDDVLSLSHQMDTNQIARFEFHGNDVRLLTDEQGSRCSSARMSPKSSDTQALTTLCAPT